MKRSPTLIDTLYRASLRNKTNPGWTDNAAWRKLIVNARRFVLDDKMSIFLGDLATQAFIGPRSSKTRARMADNLRVGARLPHATTWIEYDLRKSLVRSNELLGRPFDPSQTPQTEGWLLQQHPGIPTAIIAHIISQDLQHDHGDGNQVWTFPVAYAWTVDHDTVLPWRTLPFSETSAAPSEIALGLMDYKTKCASCVFSNLITTPPKSKAITQLLQEWTGVMRRMWALLATINDLPVLVEDAVIAKGFVARGQYRKFLAHKTITLNVPQTKHRKIVRDALALAHRRAHSVRGHWRLDWRNRPSPLCDHEWTADDKHMICKRCHGRKSWITEHERGDASRGFVTHDYLVKHELDGGSS